MTSWSSCVSVIGPMTPWRYCNSCTHTHTHTQRRRSHRMGDIKTGGPPEAEAFCETTHNICIKIQQTTVAITLADILNNITSQILGGHYHGCPPFINIGGTCPRCPIYRDRRPWMWKFVGKIRQTLHFRPTQQYHNFFRDCVHNYRYKFTHFCRGTVIVFKSIS